VTGRLISPSYGGGAYFILGCEMKGIKIIYKDNSEDWIDPCDEIIIDNGYNEYKIKAAEIKSIETYEIGECAEYSELFYKLNPVVNNE